MPARRPSAPTELPEGFLYQPEFLTRDEEAELLGRFAELPFAAFGFHGYTAKRRIVEYGWEYDFGTRRATEVVPIPDFLISIRDRAAAFAAVAPEAIVEAVITEYPPGAPIGWHRDVPQFETILGVSLASRCRMRLKPYRAEGKIVWVILEPRSLYVIRGAARWRFQHSIAAVESLRYSITLRTLRTAQRQPQAA
jgi:alkylated DNA repair dioxygenase AlkB